MQEDVQDRLAAAYEERVRVLNAVIHERERELLILSQVAARVHGAGSERDILDIALEEILTRMELNAAWILADEGHEKQLSLVASRGLAPAYLEEVRQQGLSPCLCREVFWTGHRMQARNTTHCPRMPHIIADLAEPVAHACIPLKFDGERRGVLNVAALPGEVFLEEQLRFLDTLGHQISLAVERARHREAERARDQQARAMASMSRAIGGALDRGAVFRALGDTAREVLGADAAEVLHGSAAATMQRVYASGRTLTRPIGPEAMRAALEQKRAADLGPDVHGIVLPLLVAGQPVGLLVLTTDAPRPFTAEQVETAESLASQAAVAIEKARHYEDARAALAELKQAQSRIIQSERMAVLGTFASGLAHEVRNPLNSMALQLSILERRIGRCEPALSKQMSDLTAIIREEIQRLDGLVGDFLLFSRAGHVHPRTIALRPIIDDVTRLIEPEAEAAGVTLRRGDDGDGPTAAIDPEKMKQVVLNLLRNALEALPTGGTVTVRCAAALGHAVVEVADDGPGLPDGVALFEPFVTTKPKGTGLGLAIVQQIVTQHGGEIQARNQHGAPGAVFTVTLPLAPRGEEAGS